MTVPQPIEAPFKGITLTWEQDGPVPVIRAFSVLQALGMTRNEFDFIVYDEGLDTPVWHIPTGVVYFEYDTLYDVLTVIPGAEALREHMYGF